MRHNPTGLPSRAIHHFTYYCMHLWMRIRRLLAADAVIIEICRSCGSSSKKSKIRAKRKTFAATGDEGA